MDGEVCHHFMKVDVELMFRIKYALVFPKLIRCRLRSKLEAQSINRITVKMKQKKRYVREIPTLQL